MLLCTMYIFGPAQVCEVRRVLWLQEGEEEEEEEKEEEKEEEAEEEEVQQEAQTSSSLCLYRWEPCAGLGFRVYA
jgi:hypothetical protein